MAPALTMITGEPGLFFATSESTRAVRHWVPTPFERRPTRCFDDCVWLSALPAQSLRMASAACL